MKPVACENSSAHSVALEWLAADTTTFRNTIAHELSLSGLANWTMS